MSPFVLRARTLGHDFVQPDRLSLPARWHGQQRSVRGDLRVQRLLQPPPARIRGQARAVERISCDCRRPDPGVAARERFEDRDCLVVFTGSREHARRHQADVQGRWKFCGIADQAHRDSGIIDGARLFAAHERALRSQQPAPPFVPDGLWQPLDKDCKQRAFPSGAAGVGSEQPFPPTQFSHRLQTRPRAAAARGRRRVRRIGASTVR